MWVLLLRLNEGKERPCGRCTPCYPRCYRRRYRSWWWCSYIRALDALEGFKGDNVDETTGIDIIKRAIEEPLRQIVANAGKEGAVVVQKVREGKADFGYNARTDVYENLHAAGVVDPAKVTRVALENAASIAGMFLTTECVIVEKKEDKPEMPMGAPGMGGMGGMM